MRFDVPLSPVLLLQAYAHGIFPMANVGDDGGVEWFAPDPRAVIEFREFQPGRRWRRLMRRHPFEIRIDSAFRQVMEACAAPRASDGMTWISPAFVEAYSELHAHGFAHSVEAWLDGELAGGLYGVRLGAAFMGESMVSRVSDASKVCLLTLMERLRTRGFRLLDVQFLTDHLRRFGGVEIPRAEYERRLADAIEREPDVPFAAPPTVIAAPGERSGERAHTDG